MKKLLVLATLIAGVMLVGCSKDEAASGDGAAATTGGTADAGRDGVGSTQVQEGPGAADGASRVGSKSGN